LLNLESLDSLPAVKNWVSKSKKALENLDDRECRVSAAIRANAMLQLEHLMEFPYVASAVNERGLELHAWVYHFESGQVEFLNQPVASV
jgi:carbonic anhydrase